MDWTWKAEPYGDHVRIAVTGHYKVEFWDVTQCQAMTLADQIMEVTKPVHRTPEPKQIKHMAPLVVPRTAQPEPWEEDIGIIARKIHELVDVVNELRKAE